MKSWLELWLPATLCMGSAAYVESASLSERTSCMLARSRCWECISAHAPCACQHTQRKATNCPINEPFNPHSHLNARCSQRATYTIASRTGTSMSGPTVAASASAERNPKAPTATAIASSKLLLLAVKACSAARSPHGIAHRKASHLMTCCLFAACVLCTAASCTASECSI